MQKQKKSFIQNTNTHLLVSKATNRIHFMLIEKQPKKKFELVQEIRNIQGKLEGAVIS